MSDFSYNALALVPAGSDLSVEKAVGAFASDGQAASPVTPSAGNSIGFQVMHIDNWAIVAWLEDSADVLDENQEVIEAFGNPPGVADEMLIKCDRRLSIWSDDDRIRIQVCLWADGDEHKHIVR